ncbi:bro-f [Leucania separata nucleopolyhedrovirus]|uniref:Bro-f n=1 Tax=Leucania separata nucleopolyhedrovirus TaxID=1307956 RepID=Q0IL00_NPVLS|nr:bro-f [Leucania separata nucleopolyhedrovirus]AAR28883.1 bro-f [Leucania separata nucleopolyhedrovirus]
MAFASLSLAKKIFVFEQSEHCLYVLLHKWSREQEPMFMFEANAVARLLGFARPPKAVQLYVHDDWKIKWCNVPEFKMFAKDEVPLNWHPNMWLLHEVGVYALVMRSNTTVARVFVQWLIGAILPELRKTDRVQLHLRQMVFNENEDYIFLATSETYKKLDIYMIGYTNEPDQILKDMNSTRQFNDQLRYVHLTAVGTGRGADIENLLSRQFEEHRTSELNQFYHLNPTVLYRVYSYIIAQQIALK